MSCPRHPTEFTLLKSVLEQYKDNIDKTESKEIMKGISKLFKDAKEKVDGGSGSAEEKAKRLEKKCSTAGMALIILLALSMGAGGVYTAKCYAPIQFGRLIRATNDQIRITIEVILDTGFLSISLDDPEFIKECIEWLKKAALLYLGNKLVSGTDRASKLANLVCKKLGLAYRSETSSERRYKARLTRRTARREAKLASYAKTTARETLRRRRRSQSRSASPVSVSSSRASARARARGSLVPSPLIVAPTKIDSSSGSSSYVTSSSDSTNLNPFHPNNAK